MKILLDGHKDKSMIPKRISDIPLNRMTVSRRLSNIADQTRLQLKELIENCLSLSICLDESTDINDISQMVIWARIVSPDLTTHD